jgi:hypothetical protein
MLALISIFL